MKVMMNSAVSQQLEEILTVQSSTLANLRSTLADFKKLSWEIGVAPRFTLVVDTNIIIGELIFLAAGRTKQGAKSSLMEVIEAETVSLFAPPIFFTEMEEKIPLLALQKGLDEATMRTHWDEYRTRILRYEPCSEIVASLQNSVDPDDAEFVALELTIGAHGVLSKDRHISEMGANRISANCIMHLRNYSRTAAIELHIKIGGVRLAQLTFAAAQKGAVAVRTISRNANAIPDWLKVTLFLAAIVVFVHPGARSRLLGVLQGALSGIAGATPVVLALAMQSAGIAQKNELLAESHLRDALRELGRNSEQLE